MATVYATVNGIVQTSSEKAIQTAPPGGAAANLVAEYEASSLVTAQTVKFCTIPAYSRYRVRQLNHDAMGSGTSIVVGIAGSTSEQIASVSTVSAGTAPANNGGWKQTDVDLDIIGTNTGTMTGTLQLEVEYVRRALALTL